MLSKERRSPVRILLLTEQPVLADLVQFTLNHGVYDTRRAKDSAEALDLLRSWHPELGVLDMDLGNDRLLAEFTRSDAAVPRIPVLALTRRGDLKTKLAAFDQGVEDIMTIPISPEELLARVVVITRRALGHDAPIRPVVRVGEIEIDILNRLVRAGTSEIHLTSLEQSLLYLLASRAGQIVTRNEILDALWGVDFVAESNIVDRHVRGLRVKLQNDWKKPRFIATVPGKGYRFIPQFSDRPAVS